MRTYPPCPALAPFIEEHMIVEVSADVTRLRLPEPGLVLGLRYRGAAGLLLEGTEERLPDASLAALPKRFVKMRHFGLHASTNVGEGHRLDTARALIAASAEASPNPDQPPQAPSPRPEPDLTWSMLLLVLTGDDLTLCPNCHQRTMVRQPLPLTRGPPSYPAHQPAHP